MTTIYDIANRYVDACNARTASHHANAELVAAWELENGKYDLTKGSPDYWSYSAWQEAYARYARRST